MEARRVLIDTTVFVEHLRAKTKSATTLARLSRAQHDLVTSIIVAAELFYGARTLSHQTDVEEILSQIDVLPFTIDMARNMSRNAQELKKRNAMIGFVIWPSRA